MNQQDKYLSEKTFQQWDLGKTSRLTFKDQEVAKLGVQYTLHQILQDSSRRHPQGLQALLQELHSLQDMA